MRTALRTALATALLAGLAILPVAASGTAFAADGRTAVATEGGGAAGAELGSVERGNDTALLASGAGAAVVVAGLGLTAPRRRAGARG
ncbi:hypothetical protein [Streptomyces sp. NPDC094032]|uniref:hypothetical protein n=1 Tax=Streptomyces sp. NPDC094032 TaxID=3155308 RepID=UPI00331AF72A